MVLTVIRKTFSASSTIGHLMVDGAFECFTLEPARKASGKPRAIPPGKYSLTIRLSPRFKKKMPHVESVPDFEGILIHPGNFTHDTEGCLLVGQKLGPADTILQSKGAFAKLYPKLEAALAKGPVTIEYKNADEAPAPPVAV